MKFQNHFGLDIGASTIKIVQLTAVGDKFKLNAIGMTPTPSLGPAENQTEVMARAIKQLVRELRIEEKSVVFSLPESQVYIRVVEMPFLNEPELTSAIKWQAEQYIPVPLNDVNLKHQILSLPKDGLPNSKMNVLLVAAPNAVLNHYLEIVSKAGLESIAIETEIFAVARALIAHDDVSPTTLLLNLGSDSSTLSILKKGDLALTQPLNIAGASLTRAIATELGLETTQAEEYKKNYGLDPSKLDGKVVKAIKPQLDASLVELKRVLAFYETHMTDNEPVKRMVVAGGGSLLPGLIAFYSSNLDFEVQLGNPFRDVILTEAQRNGINDANSLFSNAVGLAMKLT